MSNELLSPQAITKEALRIFHNTIQMAKKVDKQYDSQFANSGATMSGKIGPTLRIRLPNRFGVTYGAPMNTQNISEQYTTVSVTNQVHVDMQFSSQDLTLTIDEFAERYIRPAAMRLATEVDLNLTALFWNVFNQVGIPGTDVGRGTKTTDPVADASSPQAFLNAGSLLSSYTTPPGDRQMILNPAGQASAVGGLAGLFNSQTKIAEQYDSGQMGKALGFDFAMSQNIQRITCGSRAATSDVTVAAGGQTGSTLSVTCTTGDTFAQGDNFTIQGVYALNPETLQVQSFLQQFTVLAAAGGSGTSVNLSIYPAITPPSSPVNPLATVSASPAPSAPITFAGAANSSYAVNLAFIKEAFTLVTCDLIQPRGVDMYAQETMDGVRMRLVRQYNISPDILPCRLDVLFGVACVRPEFAIRVAGA